MSKMLLGLSLLLGVSDAVTCVRSMPYPAARGVVTAAERHRTGGLSLSEVGAYDAQNRLISPLSTLLPSQRGSSSSGGGSDGGSVGGQEAAEDVDAATKSVWFATELFGKAAAALRGTPPPSPPTGPPPKDLDEAIERLVADYAGEPSDPRPYFLTGKMDVALYDAECEFADPFVSFNGRDRFVANLENLAGGFITESSTRTLESAVDRGDEAAGVPPSYTTKLLVKLRLGLPWQPVLAWPWGVTHVFDRESGLIVRHIESWDVGASEGVRQLVTPGGGKRV